MYRNVELLYCTSEINITLYVNYTGIKMRNLIKNPSIYLLSILKTNILKFLQRSIDMSILPCSSFTFGFTYFKVMLLCS